MSQETLKRLVGALIVALAAWGVVSLASGSGAAPRPSGGLADAVEALRDTASLERLVFTRPGADPVELVRSAAGWTVDGMVADSGQVVRLVDGLAAVSLGEVAARNASNHARMGVASDSATTLEATVAGEPHTLLIGAQGPGFGTTYVRLPDEDDVHTVSADLRGPARRSVEEWRSKRVVAVDTAQVARLEVTRDGSTVALVRADSSWTFEDGAVVDGATVRGVLGELRDLRADGFLASADTLAATPPGGRLAALAADGRVLADVEVGSGEGDRWGRTPDSDDVFRFASYRMDRMLPTRERLTPGG